MRLPMRYVKPVDLPLPPSIIAPSWNTIKQRAGDDFDLILNIDAGFHLADKPDIPYAIVLTDPHVLSALWYDKARPNANFIFNMQGYYMQAGDIHLPYACSPDHHYAMSGVEKKYDACLIGLHYDKRNALMDALQNKGLKTYYGLGDVYDEYRLINNQSKIGLNWSSAMDINARTFEAMAMMQIPVINRLPHLDELGFEENRHYLGFDAVSEGVEKVEWALANLDFANEIALCAYNLVHEKHTYDLRVQRILETAGLV